MHALAIDIISYIKINNPTEMHFLILIPIKITLTKNTIYWKLRFFCLICFLINKSFWTLGFKHPKKQNSTNRTNEKWETGSALNNGRKRSLNWILSW